MPKGFFTQSAAVLLSAETTLEALVPLLQEFKIVHRSDENSQLKGPALMLSFRPEVNGLVQVDLRNQPWPDDMGDPKTNGSLFSAWMMGHYGPFSFPGSLERANTQLWSWPDGKGVAERHRAVIHISTTYVFGGGGDAPVMPKDYEPLAELHFVTRVAAALLKRPDALAYFNANGEMLMDRKNLEETVAFAAEHKREPLEVWTNVRMFNPGNGWMVMDTVGMGQVDLVDLEACFPSEKYDPSEVAGFLRNCSLYLLSNGEVIKHRDTTTGPGKIDWRGYHMEEPLCAPPRRLIRWFPVDGSTPPPELLEVKESQSMNVKATFGAKLARWFGKK